MDAHRQHSNLPFGALAPFVVRTFGLSWGIFAILFLVAGIVVWLNRDAMFTRDHAVTTVIPVLAQEKKESAESL